MPIPRRDADFLLYAQNFASCVQANHALYGLYQPDAVALVRITQEFEAALQLATSPLTKTAATVARKQDLRKTLEDMLRRYGATVKQNEGVDAEDKSALGVSRRNIARRKREVPARSPIVDVICATNGAHTLHYKDPGTPGSRGKPFGAVGLYLWVHIHPRSEPPSREKAQFRGKFPRSRFAVGFDEKDADQLATYWGQWVNRRGDVGPWSIPVSFTIAFGAGSNESEQSDSSDDDGDSLRRAA